MQPLCLLLKSSLARLIPHHEMLVLKKKHEYESSDDDWQEVLLPQSCSEHATFTKHLPGPFTGRKKNPIITQMAEGGGAGCPTSEPPARQNKVWENKPHAESELPARVFDFHAHSTVNYSNKNMSEYLQAGARG